MLIPRVVSVCVGACVLTSLALFGSSASAGQAEDAAKGASLLADARKAVGGEDKLADVKRLQIKGTMRRGQGNLTLEGDSEIFLEPPDKFRRNESLSIGLGGPGIERVEILNGNEVIDENTGGRGFGRGGGDFGGRGDFGGGSPEGQGARGQIDPERLKDAQRRNRQAEVARLLVAVLLNTTAPVAWIGTAQSPEGNADVIEIKPEGTPMRLFLDTTTHLPLMLTWTGGARGGARGDQPAAPREGEPAAGAAGPEAARRGGRGPGGPGATFQIHLSDYKAVSGLKLPHLITRSSNGETSEEWTIKSYKINPTFKANTFTK